MSIFCGLHIIYVNECMCIAYSGLSLLLVCLYALTQSL